MSLLFVTSARSGLGAEDFAAEAHAGDLFIYQQALKLFPARTYGPAHVKDLRAVLPGDDIDTVRSNATAVTEAVVAVNRKNEGRCFESKHT